MHKSALVNVQDCTDWSLMNRMFVLAQTLQCDAACFALSVRRSAELSVRTEGWCPENHVPKSVGIPVWYGGAPQAQKKLGELKI